MIHPSGTTPAQLAVPGDQPVRRAVRRLRWFKSTFESQVDAVSADTGIDFSVDARALTTCFLEWLRGFEAQRPNDAGFQRAYVGFSSGLMLRKLITNAPLTAARMPEDADQSEPAYFWPEGYVYVSYCLNVRSMVLEQDFHEKPHAGASLSDIRVWWSFRENVHEDSATAIGFLDLFAGEQPDWEFPGIFRMRLPDVPALNRTHGPARQLAGGKEGG